MNSLSHFVMRHKALVILVWIAALVAGVFASGALNDRYKSEFGFPGYEGYDANVAIVDKYHTGGMSDPIVAVVTVPENMRADAPEVTTRLSTAFESLAKEGFRTVSHSQTGDDAFLTEDRRTTYGLVYTPPFGEEGPPKEIVDQVQRATAAGAPEGSTVRLTGLNELEGDEDSTTSGEEEGHWLQTLIGALGALLVLLFVFGSFLAVVPLLIAGVSIMTTFLAIYGLSVFADIGDVIQYIVGLIGLGIAIDYSLLLVTRWREERARGLNKVEATHRAMATAGHAVVFSGLAVAAGLLVLVLLPVDFLRSIGMGSVLIPLISVAVSLTLLPVLLATIGDKLDWPKFRKEKNASKAWTKWATGVAKRPVLATLAALAILVPLGAAALTMQLGETPSDSLAKTGPARESLAILQSGGVPKGVLTPIEVLVPEGTDPDAVAAKLRSVDGIYAAVAPSHWRADGTALVSVLPEVETMTTDGRKLVERVQNTAETFDGVRVGGSGALLIADIDATYGMFPVMLVVVGAITFVLLVRAFRSIVLAAQAIIVNLLSIGAAYGALVLIWQEGYGSEALWDIKGLGSVTSWVPLMTFAFLFGLSMDYQVFLLSRMREQYDETGSTTDAIVTGLGRIGRLVTCAALILFLAFVSLSTTPEVDVKVMATGLGAAILIDATVLRMLLVPALTALTGRWTWWLPNWAAKLLRVQPSPVAPIATPTAAATPERELASIR